MYKYSPDTLNIPVSGQYGVAFKFGNDAGRPTSGQWEYIVAYSTSNPARTYINRKINNSALWSGWDVFTTNSVLTPTTVTLTRTENPYVSATSFNRIAAKKIGPNLIWIEFNVAIDLEEFPSGGNAVEIGKINGILSGHVPALFNIPAQNGSGTILLEVYNGALRILNWSGSPVSSFVRTTFVMIASFA